MSSANDTADVEAALTRGEARQLGSLALWYWAGTYWRYDDATGGLVRVVDPQAVAECERFAAALA